MGIEQYKIDSFKKPVSALADTPQMSADELKAWFDSNTTDELKTSVNGIVDAVLDMEADAAGVVEALDGKVDKELGKGLSENDYTDEEKQKVESTAASLTALEHNTTLIQNSGGGFAAGTDAEADTGAALGRKAWTGDGGAAGYLAYAANGGGSAGKNANSNAGGAIGADAKAGAGFAGGKSAKAVDSNGGGIDAIQLGTGTNSTPKTLQAYGYQLMDANGKIPDARLNDAPGDGALYGRKDGGWEQLASLHTHANKAILDATEVAYTENEQARIGTLESDLDTFYTDLNDLQNTAVTDAPSDGNTYARKDGEWAKLTAGQYDNQQLINFKYVSTDSYMEETTDLDHLPNGLTVVPWADGPGLGGYFVLTALEQNESSSKTGYQIKIDHTGMSQRMCSYGTWNAWSKIG